MSTIKIIEYSDAAPGCYAQRETMAHWLYSEFIYNIRFGISYEDVLGRFVDNTDGKLPLRFVAMDGETCVGTISLVKNDHAFREYKPWLASLFVDRQRRNEGIGQMLIERVKEAAWALGYDELYLRTETVGGYYRKLGWLFVEQCVDEFGLEPEVYRFTKPGAEPLQ